jgi:hypothetical protein
MTEQERYYIHSLKWREKIHGLKPITIRGIPFIAAYKYNVLNEDIENLKIYIDSDTPEKVDVSNILWDHYESEITTAIMEDVKR